MHKISSEHRKTANNNKRGLVWNTEYNLLGRGAITLSSTRRVSYWKRK